MLAKALLGAGKSAGAANYIEDVFSTYLYTGNGSTQTINNGIALGSAYGGSVYFDGTGDYLTVPDNTAFNFASGDFSIECFVYKLSTSLRNIAGQADVATGNGSYTIWINGSGYPAFYVTTNGTASTRTDLAATTAISIGSWTHIVACRSGSTMSLFVNGSRVATTTYSSTIFDSSQTFHMGGDSNGDYSFDGYISNLRVLKGTAVYDPTQTTLTVPTAPLTAISGTSLLTGQAPSPLIDNSANAFTITVTNAIAQNGGGPFTDATAGKGGLVWIKSRSNANLHFLWDTARGATKYLVSNATDAQGTAASGLTAFNSNGFSLGSLSDVNLNSQNTASWTFREQPKFFDVVTYTGNGVSGRTIAHNLGSVPGFIIVKSISNATIWACYHRSLGATQLVQLNTTDAASTNSTMWNNTAPTSSVFSVGNAQGTNQNTLTYVAYLFAHDAGGFGLTGTDNVISCGSYTGDGASTKNITLGYEPQLVLVKNASAVTNWLIVDQMRGMPAGTDNTSILSPNLSNAESLNNRINTISATGFLVQGAAAETNASGNTYIYIAIRRGPMKVPTSGTEVFGLNARTGTNANATVTGGTGSDDAVLIKNRGAAVADLFSSRLTGTGYLVTSTTAAEVAAGTTILQANPWDVMDGVKVGTTSTITNASANTFINYLFRRAPSFMDVVCYTGTGSYPLTINHNLGVIPELMIFKTRNSTGAWFAYAKPNVSPNANWYQNYLAINSTTSSLSDTTSFTSSPTSTAITAAAYFSASATNYVVYLFATLAGISKVGSYTGNGSSQTIACGFTAGARFVMIKCTSTTGDWYVWDTARGIIAGNDGHLSLNTTAAEVTTDDTIDPDNSGFIVNQVAATNVNVNAATYIFLAIA